MSKTMNTNWFIDPNKSIIQEFYANKIGIELNEITNMDLGDPAIVKAIIELKLYHLPPYYDIPTKIKGRIQAAGAPCGNLTFEKTTMLERELTHKTSFAFAIKTRHIPCIKCGTRRASKDGICYKCRSSNQKEERELSKEYNNIYKIPRYEGWTSPKTALLATTIGCTHCMKKWTGSIWLDNLDDWGDGICPDCIENYPLGHSWSVQGKMYNTPLQSYSKCQSCNSDLSSYALWGLCETCYVQWQDKYVEPQDLFNFVEKYGVLATLLIRPEVEWLNYVKTAMTHKIKWNPAKKGLDGSETFEPFKPKKKPKVVNINLKELL